MFRFEILRNLPVKKRLNVGFEIDDDDDRADNADDDNDDDDDNENSYDDFNSNQDIDYITDIHQR